MSWSWRDGLGEEIVKLEEQARADSYVFYTSGRATGAERALSLGRLLKAFERRVMRVALGGTVAGNK
jgi:hypothetical protein